MKRATTYYIRQVKFLAQCLLLGVFILSLNAAWAQPARVQFVHAAPDPALDSIDVYLDNTLWQDNFAFKECTAFTDVATGSHTFAFAPASSASVADTLKSFNVTLEAGRLYHMVAAGVLDPSQFTPNPNGRDIGLDLYVDDKARVSPSIPTIGFFDVRDFHAVPEWPTVDFSVALTSTDVRSLWNGVAYGEFVDFYSGFTRSGIVGRIHLGGRPDSILFASKVDFDEEDLQVFFAVWAGMPGHSIKPEGLLFRSDGTRLIGEDVTDMILGLDGEEASAEVPSSFRLIGNYPNPFNPVTSVQFDLPQQADVHIDLYDPLGRHVLMVPEHIFMAGAGHSMQVDATSLATGLYLYRITARAASATHVATGKMMLLK